MGQPEGLLHYLALSPSLPFVLFASLRSYLCICFCPVVPSHLALSSFLSPLRCLENFGPLSFVLTCLPSLVFMWVILYMGLRFFHRFLLSCVLPCVCLCFCLSYSFTFLCVAVVFLWFNLVLSILFVCVLLRVCYFFPLNVSLDLLSSFLC